MNFQIIESHWTLVTKPLKHLWKSAYFGKINLGIIAYFWEKHLGIIANWITYIIINQNIKFPNTKIQPPEPVMAGKLLRPYHPKRNRIPEHFRIYCKQSHKMGRRYVKKILRIIKSTNNFFNRISKIVNNPYICPVICNLLSNQNF